MNQTPKKMTIGIENQGNYALVKSADNGPGIQQESLPHIFERFYRVESSRSRGAEGSGLGLAIAQQIIEGHGGTIWATSEPGQGTTIFYTLKIFTDRR
ncbi:Sensor protein kinase WalK [compost metagenome]